MSCLILSWNELVLVSFGVNCWISFVLFGSNFQDLGKCLLVDLI